MGLGAFRRTIFMARSRLISWLFSPLSESDSEESEELASFFDFLALDLQGASATRDGQAGRRNGRVVVSRSLALLCISPPSS